VDAVGQKLLRRNVRELRRDNSIIARVGPPAFSYTTATESVSADPAAAHATADNPGTEEEGNLIQPLYTTA
jgi:hypothetical protein